MGKIKELLIDLQNEYGQDLENLPEGFDFDAYLEEKSNEQEEQEGQLELFCQKVKSMK
jgi:hypothetical protein